MKTFVDEFHGSFFSHFSNPLTYAVCLEELGEDIVHKFQGRAPSGRTFNEIALDHQGDLNSRF